MSFLPVFGNPTPQNDALLNDWWPLFDEGEQIFARWGRYLLGACALGLMAAGITIAIYGMTTVFVPSDLRFIGLAVPALQRVSPLLIPGNRKALWDSIDECGTPFTLQI